MEDEEVMAAQRLVCLPSRHYKIKGEWRTVNGEWRLGAYGTWTKLDTLEMNTGRVYLVVL